MSKRWKEIKEDPARLSEYNDRARQMQNEAEEPGDDSQNEKTRADGPTAKQPKKVPKTPELVDTDSDDSDDEQEPVVEQPKKVPKTPEFVDTDSDDSDNDQEPVAEQLQKASKTPEYSDNEQIPAVNYQKCIVMYSTEDEQEPIVKQPQKASKIQTMKALRKPTSLVPVKPKFAAGCTYILTKGIRKGKQCRFRASDETGKFCYHHKQT